MNYAEEIGEKIFLVAFFGDSGYYLCTWLHPLFFIRNKNSCTPFLLGGFCKFIQLFFKNRKLS